MGGSGQEMVRETYRVPPDFLSNLSAGAEQAAENEDIFNSEPGNAGLLAQRMGVQEALVQQGISFPNGASAFLNPATNTLRVVNTEMNQDIIRQIIDSIVQTEPVSVAVRVTILKVQKSVLEELSFDWLLNPFNFGPESSGGRVLNLAGGTVGSGNPQGTLPSGGGLPTVSNPITSGNRSGEWATVPSSVESLLRSGATRDTQEFDRAPGIIGMNGIVGNSQIQMLMRGLNQKGNFDMMAQPSVTTRSGQSASINISQEFIYPTEYDPPEVPSSVGGDAVSPVTPASPTAFNTRDVGVQLEVLPVADANRQFIDITLNPTITDFDGFVNYGSPILAPSSEGTSLVLTENTILMPVFSVKRVNTNLTVADGSTMVIGGLLKDELTNLNDKTPLLGDIPVVGRLFQSNVTRQTSTAILFLVNVELLDPTGRPFRNR
jgi:general secretion pathway protein D